MTECMQEVVYESSDWYEDQTAHGLLVAAYEQAREDGLFAAIERHVTLRQKAYEYTVHKKLATLWASIVVGCEHTVEINTKLGKHERAAAALFGMERFPDQSGINCTLRACTAETVAEVRRVHWDVLLRTTRARQHRVRTKLSKGRVLFVDIDQRGIVVRGKLYELAKRGFFGRKRGHRGYQLTLAHIGGRVNEVLDEYLDPGDTPAARRVDDVLERAARYCDACRIPRENVVIRADAQYGTPAIITKILPYRFRFLVKGICPRKARAIARSLPEATVQAATPTAQGQPRWVADLGQQHFVGKSLDKSRAEIDARTVLVKWLEVAKAKGSRPGKTTRARRALEPKTLVERHAYLLTNLDAEQLPAQMALDLYDDRATIERYFRDEQNAFGARSIRTHRAAGAAVFQLFVAITHNLLRSLRRRFVGTPLEHFGPGRLIKQAFQVPAKLIRAGKRLRVVFPRGHLLVEALVRALSPTPIPPPPATPVLNGAYP